MDVSLYIGEHIEMNKQPLDGDSLHSERSREVFLKDAIMNAYSSFEDKRSVRPQQIGVPISDHVEQTPDFMEFLARALEAKGDFQKASAVRRHAMGYYWLFTCAPGHIAARQDICGHHLCAWCRWHQLKTWAEPMAKRAGCETKAYKFEIIFNLKSDSIDSIKSVLKRTMLPHGGSPAFGI